MSPEILENPLRELAHRASGSIDVTLYWQVGDDTTHIHVWHRSTDERLDFVVARERALDAFYHPFAHIPIADKRSTRSLQPR